MLGLHPTRAVMSSDPSWVRQLRFETRPPQTAPGAAGDGGVSCSSAASLLYVLPYRPTRLSAVPRHQLDVGGIDLAQPPRVYLGEALLHEAVVGARDT